MTSNTLPSRALTASFAAQRARAAPVDLTKVYEAHFRYVWRCLRSLGVSDGVLDDAVQEVFLVVQRKLSAFDGGCELRTWLYAIVLRIARRYRAQAARDARRFSNHETSPEASAAHVGVIGADLRHEVEKNERLALAQRALSLLDDAKREVFVFACIEGMSAPEIARMTGVPLNTIYSRLRAARQAFAHAVDRLSEPAPPGGNHDG